MLEMYPIHDTYETQPCQWCGTPIHKQAVHPDECLQGQPYKYAWHLVCPKCSTLYLVSEAIKFKRHS